MIKENDKIQLESRREIENLMTALNTYAEEHPNESATADAKRLSDLLEVMHMCW